MLRKFIQITNVGKFRDYRSANQVDMRKLSLVFAPNGRGKSTLCAILRSLAEGRPELITERATLDAENQLAPEVRVLLEGGERRFQNGAWQGGEAPEIVIFDSTFIHENVFTGDEITAQHRRGLLDVILGKQGVELAQRLREVDQQLRAKDAAIREAERLVSADCGALPVDDFLAMAEDPDIDEKITRAEQRVTSLNRAAELRAADGLSVVAIPAGLYGIRKLLSRTLEDAADGAEALLRTHMQEHGMQRGRGWLTTGLSYITDANDCPFCGQGLAGLDLIKAYRACFSEAYQQLRSGIDQAIEDARGLRASVDLAAVQKAVSENEASVEYWRRSGLELKVGALDVVGQASTTIEGYFDVLDACLQNKAAAPLDDLAVPKDLRNAVGELRSLRKLWLAYNKAVHAANVQIRAFKAGLDDTELPAARAELARLRAQKKRHEPEVAGRCQTLLDLRAEREGIIQQRDTARNRLNEYNERVMPDYRDRVNDRLRRYGVDFSVCNLQKRESGRSPNASYQLEINRVPVNLNPVGDDGGPAFHCTLSSGDRSALAFAFFMAQVDAHPDPGNLCVVLDDPFSSLDVFRLEQTATQLRRLMRTVKQLVVLSHSSDFLGRVHAGYQEDGVEIRHIQLDRREGGNTRITPWDISDTRKSTFERHFDKLKRFKMDGDGDPLDVILHVRQTLEHDLRQRYGTALRNASWAGDMIETIRGADADSPLAELQPRIDELTDINEYVKQYYHGPEASQIADHPPIDDTELRAHVDLVLDFVHPPQV